MRLYSVSSSFTRPSGNLAYSANALVTNDPVAGNCLPLTFSIPRGMLLTNVKLTLTGSNIGDKFTLYLYQFSPTFQVGDGSTSTPLTTESNFLGSINLYIGNPLFSDNTSGQSQVDPNLYPLFTDTLNNNQVYGILTTNSAFTLSSNTIVTVTLIGVD